MVDPVLQSSIFFNGFDAQHQNDNSTGDAFQSELDEVAVSETATTGSMSLGDDVYIGGVSAPKSVSAAFWQIEVNDAPKTLEDVQDDLDAASEALRTEFLEFSGMNFAERIRANILKDKNLTEEDLAKLEPDERAAIEEEIKQAILRAMGVDNATNGEDGAASTA
ncbi:hypothetical protein [uncultured Agrobacterium sp.]|uniref:hypothetical protein n=1 Tax=uncultured Agrobacterium sp. TaxID=157277 RepID=UPI0025834E69|nr:hypothetical protein [uncultured Agrobacterium sp.]